MTYLKLSYSPFLLWPASLHSGELLPFKVNVASGSSELGAEKPLAVEPQPPASSERGWDLEPRAPPGALFGRVRGLMAGEADQTVPGLRAASRPWPLPQSPAQLMAVPMGSSCHWAMSCPDGDQGNSADSPPSPESSACM